MNAIKEWWEYEVSWEVKLTVFVIVVIVVCSVITGQLLAASCERQAEIINLDYQYDLMSGCYINTPDWGWYPLGKYLDAVRLH